MRVRRRAVLLALGGGAVLAGAPALAAAQAPPGPPHVASFAAPTSVFRGERAEVSGRIAPAGVMRVVIQRLDTDHWAPVAVVTTRRNGRFSARVPIAATTNLRASVDLGDGTAAVSRRRWVAVRRRVSVAVVPADPLEQIAGRPFRLTGALPGAKAGERASLQGSLNGRRYRPIASVKVRAGRVAATFTPPSGGHWRFRLVAAPTPGRDAGGSATTGSMEVFGVNPDHVPAAAPNYLVQHLSEYRLYYYTSGKLRRVFPVVFGKPSTPTPVGRFAVYSKTAGPSPAFGPLVLWYYRGYGIHGTNEEYLLSRYPRAYSHGCTRNYNVNIEWLWPRIPIGTPVLNVR
jgi:hypothetical protein